MSDQAPMKKRYLKAEALSLVREGEYDEGIEKYKEFLALNPQDDDAWAGLGGAYRRKGELDDAILNYEKAYAVNPQSTYALVNIVALRAARHTEEDETTLTEYIPKAKQLTQQIIDSGKGDFWTWYDLATLQLLQKDTEEAIRTFNYAVELTPKTAKENFRSVLQQLEFLRDHNPTIPEISRVIELVSRYIN